MCSSDLLATQDISPQLVITSYANEQVGVINENSAGVITYDQVSSYGVVHIGVGYNQCSSFSNNVGAAVTGHLLDDLNDASNGKLQKLKNYMNNGGVIWFNAEWWNGSPAGNGCSNKDENSTFKIIAKSVGTVDYKKGEILINTINIVSTVASNDVVEIQAFPDSNDVIGLKDLYLSFDVSNSKINKIGRASCRERV